MAFVGEAAFGEQGLFPIVGVLVFVNLVFATGQTALDAVVEYA